MNNATKIIIVIVVLAVAAGAIWIKQGGQTDSAVSNSAPTASSPETSGTAEPTGPLPLLVDLGAGACSACKALAPIIDSIGRDFAGQLDVEKIDVSKEPQAAKMFKVRVIPLLVFMDAQGKELARHEGYLSREKIMSRWRLLGYDFKLPDEAN